MWELIKPVHLVNSGDQYIDYAITFIVYQSPHNWFKFLLTLKWFLSGYTVYKLTIIMNHDVFLKDFDIPTSAKRHSRKEIEQKIWWNGGKNGMSQQFIREWTCNMCVCECECDWLPLYIFFSLNLIGMVIDWVVGIVANKSLTFCAAKITDD